MQKNYYCVDCENQNRTIKCSVCNRPVCKECSDSNNNKYNTLDDYKNICDYCGCIYWRGF